MFTPVHTTLGALLLFGGSFGLLLHNGKVFGISSLLSGCVLRPSLEDNVPIIAGLASSPAVVSLLAPSLIPSYPDTISFSSSWTSVLSTLGLGLLVGWGTKNGKGCTSGHMLCGLSRLSPRSLIATSVFFTTALLTANLIHPGGNSIIPPCDGGIPCYTSIYPSTSELAFMASSTVLALVTNLVLVPRVLTPSRQSRALFAYLAGVEFGLGLLFSGMADPYKVIRFFAFLTDPFRFDPSLALIILFGIGPSLCGYLATNPGNPASAGGKDKPTLAERWNLPTLTVADIDWRFIAGAVAFGVGWGLSGTCPGPAVLRSVLQPAWGAVWMGGYILGNLI
ncbi:hypothetical protein VTN77DRAFT_5016 [Rasamsonia byssochlamydoides]|uniref:uncharacterized protein n=1 Tax=Rasamsonia byssochlamydoides TaxID=89139 RepID=UPI00374431E3